MQAFQFIRTEKAQVLAFVVMPDHFHALLVPRPPFTLSQVMQSLKGYSSREVNKLDEARGTLWQKSYYDRVIRTEDHLNETVRYLYANPVEAGLAELPEEYPYSSAFPGVETDLEAWLAGDRGQVSATGSS